jgi:hypothetical protein
MMERVLDSRLIARQAYELIVPALVYAGMERMRAPLVDFLTLDLVLPTEEDTEPLLVQTQVGLAA